MKFEEEIENLIEWAEEGIYEQLCGDKEEVELNRIRSLRNKIIFKEQVKDAIYNYLKSDRGKARDFNDLIYYLGEELRLK